MKTEFTFEGKKIGWIEEDTFYAVRELKHWFYIYQGFGASISVLAELQKRNINNFCVIFKRNLFQETELKCKVVDFYNYGEKFIDTSKGFEDPQLILNIEHFNHPEKQTALEVAQ